MITIECKDKNGIELSNGDTVRWFEIEPVFEELDGFWGKQEQYDTRCRWVEEIYNPTIDDFGSVMLPPDRAYDFDDLIRLFGINWKPTQEEIEECILDPLRELTTARDLNDILEEISGFSVVSHA